MDPRGWSNRKRIIVGIVGLFVLLIIISAATSSSTTKKTKTTAARSSPSTTKPSAGTEHHAKTSASAGDAQAEAEVNEALGVIAKQDEIFHNYDLVTPVTLGNLDHSLKAVKTLKASSTKTTYVVSVTAPGGTTFTAHWVGRNLTRTCAPAGGACHHGHWSGASTLAMPKIPVLTAQDKAAVRSILLASVSHYAGLLSQGQQILGSTQYPSAQAGLRAFSDPSSAASRFSAYQKNPDPQKDLSFLKAFEKAQHYFVAANEPAAVGQWRDTMSNAQAALYKWVQDGVSWQIKEVSTARLDADAAKVTGDLDKARALAATASR